jgi:NRAMP (natural resistance-associated macrophage protein)-like metal ion transporter
MTMSSWSRHAGPGALVAAAFIGPGTVTVCTLAGIDFGYELLWAMLLSVLATMVLQEMAARLGLVTGQGLTHVLRDQLRHHPVSRVLVLLLILAAVVVGNAAYEAGNISGGRLGLETLLGVEGRAAARYLSLPIGAAAFVLLYLGSYRILERALVLLVVLMSLSFLVTALLTRPDVGALFRGLLVPTFSDASLLTVVGLIGTTVVPYNLFLHASLVQAKWQGAGHLRDARRDTIVAVSMGGLVSLSIIVSAAAVDSAVVRNAADLARSLEPLFGETARYLLSIGLFAAGITSAITAPLAAAYVTSGCMGWGGDLRHPGFRVVWMGVLALGVLFSSLGISPIEIIRFAQVANGIALPVVVGILLWLMNREVVLGIHKNQVFHNVAGGLILVVTVVLGWRAIAQVLGSL